MKRIFIIVFMIFVITGCVDDKIKDSVGKFSLMGKYECLCDTNGIEYSMIYEFSNNKLQANVNNQTTDVSYTFKDSIIETVNVVDGKKMTGSLDNNKIIFTEKDSKITISCTKK